VICLDEFGPLTQLRRSSARVAEIGSQVDTVKHGWL
jgi:hypothetical protein